MPSSDLLGIYCMVIRAAVEYCSVVYHSLIPRYMAERLERVQVQAMKIIFGRGMDYGKMVEDGKIETLEKRRLAACRRFATKAAASGRFGTKWFPRNGTERTVRSTTRKEYVERNCRTERGRNNPIQYMIRMLNEEDSTLANAV